MKLRVLIMAILFLIVSCENETEKEVIKKVNKNDFNTVDTNIVITPELLKEMKAEELESSKNSMLIASFKVKDFNEWETNYKKDLAYNPKKKKALFYTSLVDNPNTVGLIMITADNKKVEQQLNSPEFQKKAESMGIISPIDAMYLKIMSLDQNAHAKKYNIAITHEVKDFDNWNTTFKADKKDRINNGITDVAVAVNENNYNIVTVLLATNDIENCKKLFKEPHVVETLKTAGVIGQPSVSYWEVKSN